MKKLLNTLYITNDKAYLRLDGDDIVVEENGEIIGKVPLLNFESIVYFGYPGASPALLGYLAKNNIPISFLTPYGKFLARVNGEYHGNIVLRKEQYLISDKENRKVLIARNMIFGKVANQKFVLDKFAREYKERIETENILKASEILNTYLDKILICENSEVLRGYEGYCAEKYFSVLDDLILKNKNNFYIKDRNKRPPKDNVNAVLSFLYTLLAHDCASALETVGLDPYCGFLHTEVPGRISLALDLMEEMRPVVVDRFVISLINTLLPVLPNLLHKIKAALTFDADTLLIKNPRYS